MQQYEIITTILAVLPILSLLIIFMFVKNLKWTYRYPIVVIGGWVIVFLSTILFWHYSFNYAPTKEIQQQIAMSDGAPVAFSYIFGWVYALILMLIMDSIYKSYVYLLKKYRRKKI